MKPWLRSPVGDMVVTLGLASLVCLVLYGYTVHRAGEVVFRYLPGNLVLAWLPVLLALLLARLLKTRLWSSWPTLAVSLAWLVFLPNSFYIVTDLIHLQGVYTSTVVADSVMFAAFVVTGLLLGFTSLYLVHRELLQRLSTNWAVGYVTAILFLCSLAIYIGRDLRWNSWDVLVSPAGMLFDLSDRLLHPSQYGDVLSVSLSFFVLLGGMYLVAWRLVEAATRSGQE
jgi:uncharacterized membrane protein